MKKILLLVLSLLSFQLSIGFDYDERFCPISRRLLDALEKDIQEKKLLEKQNAAASAASAVAAAAANSSSSNSSSATSTENSSSTSSSSSKYAAVTSEGETVTRNEDLVGDDMGPWIHYYSNGTSATYFPQSSYYLAPERMDSLGFSPEISLTIYKELENRWFKQQAALKEAAGKNTKSHAATVATTTINAQPQIPNFGIPLSSKSSTAASASSSSSSSSSSGSASSASSSSSSSNS